MQMADCAKMMHHSEDQSEDQSLGHKHTDDSDGACEDMSLACMQAMNAVAPVWLGSDPTPSLAKHFTAPAIYTTDYQEQLASQISAPDYPPPRT